MTKVRWGVLGLAKIARTRTIPAFGLCNTAVLKAVASRDGANASYYARDHNIPHAYGSYQSLLEDPDIDAVYIPLPNNYHFEWCLRAMEAGKHVLCEKPLCLAANDIESLIEVRDRTCRHIEEALCYRNHPQWQALAALIADGTIGEVRAAHGLLARHFNDPTDIRNNVSLGGGALYDLGTYAVSACNQVFCGSPRSVVAKIERDPSYGTDRLTTAILDYPSGQATVTVGTQSGPAQSTHQQFSVLGTTGWLRCDFPYAHARPHECHIFVGRSESIGCFETSTLTFEPVNQYALQLDRFSQVICGADAGSWPIEDALATIRTLEAIFSSAQVGSWISVANGDQRLRVIDQMPPFAF